MAPTVDGNRHVATRIFIPSGSKMNAITLLTLVSADVCRKTDTPYCDKFGGPRECGSDVETTSIELCVAKRQTLICMFACIVAE